MKLSEYIKDYRITHGLSLREMAERCHCSFQYLSKLENGQISNPTIETVAGIARGTGTSVHELSALLDDFNVSITLKERRENLQYLNAIIAKEHEMIYREEHGLGTDSDERNSGYFEETELLILFRKLTPEQRAAILTMMKGMVK